MTARRWLVAALAVAAAAVCGLTAVSGARRPPAAAQPVAVGTAEVQRGRLSSLASGPGP